MKKLFVSKSVMKKIALVLVLIILFQVVISRPVEASGLGGTLLSPIVNLVVYLADGAISILQNSLTTAGEPFTYIDLSGNKATLWGAIITCVVGVLLAVGAVVATVLTAGTAAAAIVAVIAPMAASAGLTAAVGSGVILAFYKQIGETLKEVVFGNSFVYSNIFITPEALLKNQIAIFDVNFFQDITSMTSDKNYDLAITIRSMIQGIYTTLRDISVMTMLIVIVYIAIKMLISLSPKEKSRYKEGFANCIVGVFLIVFMHLIMSITTTGISMISAGIVGENLVYECDINEESTIEEQQEVAESVAANEELRDKYTVGGAISIEGENIYKAVTEEGAVKEKFNKIAISEENKIMVSASNFLELSRYKLQKVYDVDSSGENKQTNWTHIGWALVYVMLVILTIAFTLLYAKRFLYMAALTMFAPIVGLMYPINKADGSRAQTLNLWFREYIGNLIIQPFHMFLYTVLIGGAIAVALENPIYVIVALMAMTFIEKMLKDLVGIQDTRIGGLGSALSDTNRAIKGATRATRDMARAAHRTIDGAARGAVKLGAGMAEKAKRDAEEEEAKNPRMQPPPEAAANEELQEETLARRPDPDDPDSMQVSRDPMDVHEEESLAFNSFEESQPESLYSGDEDYIDQLREQGYTEEEIQEQIAALEEVRAAEKRLEEEAEAKRLAEQVSPEEEAELLRAQLSTQGYSEEEIEEQIRDQIGEIPRIGANESELRAEQGTQLDEEMQPEELAEAMRRTGMSEKELLHGKTIGRDYNPSLVIGENEAVATNPNAQIPSFLDPETASKVARERMEQLEEDGAQRFRTKNGIEAVVKGKEIVADFAARPEDIDPVVAMAQEIPQELAVGQDFMPNINREMDTTSSNVKMDTPTLSGGATTSLDRIEGQSFVGEFSVGSVAGVETTKSYIEYHPEKAGDSAAETFVGGKEPIQFNPAGAKTVKDRNNVIEYKPEGIDYPTSTIAPEGNNTVQFKPSKAAASTEIPVDKQTTGVNNNVTYTTGFESISGQASIGEEVHTDNKIMDTATGINDVTYTTGFESAPGMASREKEVHIDNKTMDTATGINDVTYTTGIRDTSGPENVTSSSIQEKTRYTNDISSVSINPDISDRGSATRTNIQVNRGEKDTVTRGGRTIDFIQPQVSNDAPEIPTEQRRIQFESNPTRSRGSGEIESGSVRTEPTTRASTRRVEREEGTTTPHEERRADTPEEILQERQTQQATLNKERKSIERAEQIARGMEIAGAVTGGVTGKVGDLVEGVISMAADGVSGNVGAVKDTAKGLVTGTMEDVARAATVANTIGTSEGYRGAGQISDDAEYLRREGFGEQDAHEVERYCQAYKIDDKRNKALVGIMYQESDSRVDKKLLTKLAAEVIKAKKNGLKKEDVEAYLNNQKISQKTKKALLNLFEKAHK